MKKIVALMVAFVASVLMISVTAYAANEVEDNDSKDKATAIAVNEDVNGAIADRSDADWYMFTIPESGYITVEFFHPVISSTSSYWYIYLYQADGITSIYGVDTSWVVEGNKDKKTAEIGLPAGSYYIKVMPEAMRSWSDGRFDTSTYTLKVNYTAKSNWETEINNSYSDADWISVNEDIYGSICGSGDSDWFAFSLTESGYVSFSFTHPVISSASSYWYMYLYQSDGVTPIYGVDTSWSIDGNRDKTTAEMGLAAGTYYIRIIPEALRSWSDGRIDYSTYTLKVNYTQADNWESEINNSYSDADSVPVNSSFYGSICGTGDSDWFKFELKSKADISIHFSHESNGDSNTYWIMYLYMYDGVTTLENTQSEWYVSGNKDETTDEITMPEGTYYIRLIPEALRSWSDGRIDTSTYSISINERHDHVYGEWTVTLEPTCTEPGSREHACTICGNTVSEKISPTGHSFGEWIVDVDSTCTKEGSQHHDCEVCGFSESKAIEKKPHEYGDWVTVKEPSCTEEGVKQRLCKECGDAESAAIEMVPHEYGELQKVSGSIFSAPIVSERKCINCEDRLTYENWDYKWVTPTIITVIALIVLAFLALLIYKNRKKIFKTSFVCPYCFETHKMSEVEFRCSNNHCKDVPDLVMTKYENGDLTLPLIGKPTFKSSEIVRGKKSIPRAATCPECHRVTHKVVCPSCHNILPESTLLGEDMIISIVGSRDSGKSHFVGVIINELITRIAPAFGGSLEGFDDTQERYERTFGNNLYVNLQKLDLTQSSLQNTNNGAYRPLIYSLKFGRKGLFGGRIDRYTLVFFDTAGEDLNDADTMSTVNKYICKSAGVIFLVDPMKIPAVAMQLDEDTLERASSVDWQHATRSDDILVRVSNLIRNDKGLKSSDQINVPVAVVFSKFDAIESIIPKGMTVLQPSPHCQNKAFVLSDWHNVNTEVQGLLRSWGAETFLAQLDVNYSDYSCFAASSLGLNNNPSADRRINRPHPHRIEDPLLWILSKLKVIKSK